MHASAQKVLAVKTILNAIQEFALKEAVLKLSVERYVSKELPRRVREVIASAKKMLLCLRVSVHVEI